MTTVRPHGLAGLIVDLSAVTFLDSSGSAVPVELHRLCEDNDTPFALSGAGVKTRRRLAIARLDTVVDIC